MTRQDIITYIKGAIANLEILQQVFGEIILLEVGETDVKTFPADATEIEPIPINIDNYTSCSMLVLGDIDKDQAESEVSCEDEVRWKIPLTVYVWHMNDDCKTRADLIAQNIDRALSGRQKQFSTAHGLFDTYITVTGSVHDAAKVFEELYKGIPFTQPNNAVFVKVTYTIEITGKHSCFVSDACAPPGTYNYNYPVAESCCTEPINTVGNGTDAYTNTALIGKTILQVFIDGTLRDPSEYTFNDTTGTITLPFTLSSDVRLAIFYK